MVSTPNVIMVESPDQTVSRRVVVSAPAADLFDLVADPHRHGELDGSGTVFDAVAGPDRLRLGDRFSVAMKLGPLPYRIASAVTGFEENALLEWRHPVGHRWRWQFVPLAPGRTEVTETWDYRDSRGRRFLELTGYPRINGDGITRTLEQLYARFPPVD
jgi:hypothetical protein